MNQNVSILAIDDDKEILYALGAVCEYKSWRYYLAEDVNKGIKIFKEEAPDIVLIDYHLPGVNGITGVKMIRELSKDVPIIVFTVEESQEVANEFLDAGASDFALKPIKAPDIISRISLHIKMMEIKNKNTIANDFVAKGIGKSTLGILEDCLRRHGDFATIEYISCDTGFAEQTVYRYMQHMEGVGTVEVKTIYGKVGRPKKSFKLRAMP